MWSYTEVERCEIKLLWNWGRSVKKCNYTDDFHWAVMWSGSISFYITNTLQPAKLSAAFNKSFDSSFIRWLSVDLVCQIHTCQSDSDTRGCGPALSEPPNSFDKNSDLRPPPVLGVAGLMLLWRLVCLCLCFHTVLLCVCTKCISLTDEETPLLIWERSCIKSLCSWSINRSRNPQRRMKWRSVLLKGVWTLSVFHS